MNDLIFLLDRLHKITEKQKSPQVQVAPVQTDFFTMWPLELPALPLMFLFVRFHIVQNYETMRV